MGEYIGIKGGTVQSLASDPSPLIEGQVWYNTTSNVIKGTNNAGSGTWASGTSPSVGKYGAGSAGTTTAALQIAGHNQSTATNLVTTETYDGTTWTEVGDLSTGGSYGMGCGTQTAAFFAGASSPLSSALAQTWNGSSWTAGPAFLTLRYGGGGGGITTSAVYATGWKAPGHSLDSETWDGTSWSEGNNCNTGRSHVYCSGSSESDAMMSGGGTPARSALVETYDGTSWTVATVLPEAMVEGGGMGSGNTSAIVFGGGTPAAPINPKTKIWNGSAWTEVGDLGTARQTMNQGGSTGGTGAFCLGGYSPAPAPDETLLCEEYTGALGVVTFTTD